MVQKQEFSKYERARILGARALQISMDAPLLRVFTEDELNNLNYDPLKLAKGELDSGVLPIAIDRPLPDKRDEKLKELKLGEIEKDEEVKVKQESDEDELRPGVATVEKEVPAVEMKPDDVAEEELEDDGVESEVVAEESNEE